MKPHLFQSRSVLLIQASLTTTIWPVRINLMRHLRNFLSILLVWVMVPAYADNFVSFTNSGNWDDVNTWKQNKKAATRLPNASDDVIISNGDIVKVRTNVSCASLTLEAGSGTAELIFLSPVTLKIDGQVTINNPNNNTNVQNINSITVGTGTLIASNLHIKADNGGSGPQAAIAVTTGSLIISNDISYVGGAKAKLELGNQGYLEIGGDLGNGTGGDFQFHPNSTVNFNGKVSQQRLRTSFTFGNIKTNNLLGVRPDGPVTPSVIAGNLTVESGLFHNNGFTIQGAAGKSLLIKNNATLTLTGTTTFPGGFGYTTLENNSNVVYGGGNQQVAARPYGNLQLLTEAPATKSDKILTGNATINGNLNFGAARLLLGDNILLLEDNATVSNASQAGYVVQNSQGKMLVKNLGADGRNWLFMFPVGTATSYTPAQLINFGPKNTFSVNVQDGIRDRNQNLITEHVVKKTWNISQETTNGVASLSMQLQWNISDEATNFNRANCGISHFESGQWHQPTSFKQATVNQDGSMAIELSDVRSFSPFGIGDGQSALPVELLYFKAAKQDDGVALTWETASEKNNKGYEIQTSTDGKHFEYLGFVASKNGNANYCQRYEFLDKISRTGLVYYRLKQTDFDGTVTYYAAKVVDMGKFTESVSAYPNPFRDQFEIKLQAAAAQDVLLQITDMAGKTVYRNAPKVIAGQNMIPIELENNLPAGLYILTAKTATQVYTTRIVKQ